MNETGADRLEQRFEYWMRAFLTRIAMGDRRVRRLLLIVIDIVLLTVSVWLALSLRLGYWQFIGFGPLILIAVATTSWLVVAGYSGIYRSITRSAGSRTMFSLSWACALLLAPMATLFFLFGVSGVPRTIGFLQPIIFLILLLSSRLAIRFVLVEALADRSELGKPLRVLIYGAGRAGQQLATALRHERYVELAGFLDDNPLLVGAIINGHMVYPATAFDRLVRYHDIDEVLLALPSVTRSRRREIFEALSNAEVQVRSLPSIGNIIDGRVSVSDLRQIKIDELLGRESVPPDEALLSHELFGRVVLVTGAGGSIGSELCRQILQRGPKQLVLVEQSEYALYSISQELRATIARVGLTVVVAEQLVNIGSAPSVHRLFAAIRPDVVFHAAAYKHVPLVEANPISGLWNNVFGTLNCCVAAEDVGARRFILVSTDKAVRPTNIMGASKRICELILQARAAESITTIFSMVRFGNVLGSSGSVVPKFSEQIAAGGPVTITDERMTRYFMTIPEAAQLVIQAGAMSEGGEVFVLDMGQPVLIRDLADTMIRLSGFTVRSPDLPDGDIEIKEVGLRPGEKLFEELLIGSNTAPTAHRSIMRADEPMILWPELAAQLGRLGEVLGHGDADGAVQLVRKLVPEYAPS